jgi:hypothetical protein
MNEVAPHTIQIEVVKTGLRQTKDGIYCTFVLHPQDKEADRLISAHVGTQYVMVLAETNDDSSLVEDQEVVARGKLVTSAVLMCDEPDFQSFLGYTLGRVILNGELCGDALREFLQIESRSDLKTNDDAAQTFEELRGQYMDWRKQR